ncbi:MAG TPA: sigma-70 family RNA polymerase sigma factor [Bacillus sp. (in: firmicutes)]|uniref:sigma-70 family RNA polymerase sigma factor n=1 Tax=Bacillus litorisediminis TaxID=2922713 RepID=UPI001FAD3948|nr:sigma-70 family RNA polymerase sigma factor [Bacillus litorisediminis]HWO75752.1 sigma-70 family RNA polymerase sigma factor [Bacillus sp. (in: firmicutes)]
MTQKSLVKRAIKGDDGAFYELIQREKNKLYKIAILYLKNEDDAIEAVQEITYRAYCSISSLRKPQYFSTWIVRILINYCFSLLKERKRLSFHDEMAQILGGKEDAIYLDVYVALEKLEENQRNAITLKYLHQFKIREIADILECPDGTVKTWIHKGLETLRLELRDEEGGAHRVYE